MRETSGIVRFINKKYPSEIFAKLKETKIVLPGSSESIKVNILDKFDEYGKFLFGEDWAEHV